LQSTDAARRAKAKQLLNAAEPEDLCRLAGNSDSQVRQASLEVLEEVRPDLYPHVVALVVDCSHADTACSELAKLGERGQPAVPLLLAYAQRMMAGDDPRTWHPEAAIYALGEVGTDNPEVLTFLFGVARSCNDKRVFGGPQLTVVRALETIGRQHHDVRKAILKCLTDICEHSVDGEAPIAAIQAMGAFGPDATDVISLLKKLKLASDVATRKAASEALAKLVAARPRLGQGQRASNDKRPTPQRGEEFARNERRRQRSDRWGLRFQIFDGDDYRRQLQALGAILAIPDGDDGYLVIRDLTPPVKPKSEDIRTIHRISQTVEYRPMVAQLAKALGLAGVPSKIVQFFPESLEKDLLKKELAFRGREEQEIQQTIFDIFNNGGKCTIRVGAQFAK
jgi:hypothetical protein